MWRIIFWVLLVIAAPIPCHANIGETLHQCITRFGQPVAHGKGDSTNAGLEWYAFRKGSFMFEDQFMGEKVIIETVWKPHGLNDPSSERIAFSSAEQKALLISNSGKETWVESQPPYTGVIWRRTDGATASYSELTREMHFGMGGQKR